MKSEQIELEHPHYSDNHPGSVLSYCEDACLLLNFVGWRLEGETGDKERYLLTSGRQEAVELGSLQELRWFLGRLLSRIRFNAGRWFVINAYLSGSKIEQLAILDWLNKGGDAAWKEEYQNVRARCRQMLTVRSLLEHKKEEVLFPGVRLCGLTVVEDRPGGEHIQVESKDPVYGFILREILREEWRRLNGSIPDAQAVRTGRDRL
jgi:hypothetical protein